MNQRKKKAFTLTELLVVVVIIGVLAAVVLPKFNKVIETRKTTEAEEVMAAVRTEQERRCALDKPYIGNINKLVTAEVLPQTETKNYTYSLESTGMWASSKGMSYELKMPSYADGRVCCEGADCGKLNKDYPTCDELIAKVDYQASPSSCIYENPVPPDPKPTFLECSNPILERACTVSSTCGFEKREIAGCNHETGEFTYSDWDTTECSSAPKETTGLPCKKGCGTATVSYTCNNSTGEWESKEESCDRSDCKCLVSSGCEEVSVRVASTQSVCTKTGTGFYDHSETVVCSSILDTSNRLPQVKEKAKNSAEAKGYKEIPADCSAGGSCACDAGTTYYQVVNHSAPFIAQTNWKQDDNPRYGPAQVNYTPKLSLMSCVQMQEDGSCPVSEPVECKISDETHASGNGVRQTRTYQWEKVGEAPGMVNVGGVHVNGTEGLLGIQANEREYYSVNPKCGSLCGDPGCWNEKYYKEQMVGECTYHRASIHSRAYYITKMGVMCPDNYVGVCCADAYIVECQEVSNTVENITLP